MSELDVNGLAIELRGIAKNLVEIHATLRDLETRLRELERSDAGTHPIMQSRIDSAWRKIDEHSEQLKNFDAQLATLREANKLLAWIGSILGSAIIIWLMTQILSGI